LRESIPEKGEMMLKQHPPIHLYLWPIVFILGAGWLYVETGWGWVTAGIFAVAFIACLHLIGSDVLEKYRQIIAQEDFRNDTIRKMDDTRLYAAGLVKMPTEVKVTIDKTAAEGNEFSQLLSKLPVFPWQMKMIAKASLNGIPFTIRQWAGKQEDGKLLSDPTYRELEAALLSLHFIEYKHPTSPQQGVRWTDTGKQMLEQCVADALT
jgi:hypothetical protein